ncbi:MAG: single-stranded-DNA-specific exonuclease RecJ [Rickettsiales bacterium]|jgi:single-stranded-DNA-specific exonuclease|nr:single-stranded-DNA-specific exonuclease RecJ [Rickettsiales bacterium]
MRFRENKSVRGYFWSMKKYDENLALTIFQKKSVSTVVSKLLAIKNIELDDIDDYLKPKIKNLLKNPYHLLDMKKAVEAIYEAIINGKKICIFGDYDVDGATATALMVRFFRSIGLEVETYIPDRIEDGYGLNKPSIEKLKNENIDFIITVDCGISSYDAVQFANSIGIDVVITDHHLGPTEIPHAKAVVNPNRLDEESEYKYLAGVGVAFIVCIALNTYLREKNYYKNNNIKEKNLLYMLDLVALGTVCDVMPLVNINRAFVKQGLEIFKQRTNIGLAALSDLMDLREVNDTYHLGYVLGPRINASGRVGDVSIGNKLLSCEDIREAKCLAEQLNNFNTERQIIEKDILVKAIEKIEKYELYRETAIFVQGDDWHEGVIGIIASRIKDKYNRPVFVLSISDKVGKASCRSIDKSIDIGSVIIKTKEKGLLLSGGGHAMAGGFTFETHKLPEIEDFIKNSIKNNLDIYLEKNDKFADLVLDCESINEKLIQEIENMGPFGADNTKPTIILKDVVVLSTKKFGKNREHLRCIVGVNSGIFDTQNTVIVNIFRIGENDLLLNSLEKVGTKCDLIGNISINKWMNLNNIQFIVEDVIL